MQRDAGRSAPRLRGPCRADQPDGKPDLVRRSDCRDHLPGGLREPGRRGRPYDRGTAVLRRRHRRADPRLNPIGCSQPRHHRHRVLDRAARSGQPELAERPARMPIGAPVGWPDGRPPGDDARQLELHPGERRSPQHEWQRRQPHDAERLSDPPGWRVRARLHDDFAGTDHRRRRDRRSAGQAAPGRHHRHDRPQHQPHHAQQRDPHLRARHLPQRHRAPQLVGRAAAARHLRLRGWRAGRRLAGEGALDRRRA